MKGTNPPVKQRQAHFGIMSIVLLFLVVQLAACSKIPSAQLRQANFKQFLALGSPQILIYRPQLSVRSPGLLVGARDQGPELGAMAGIGNPLQTLATQFIATAALPEVTSVSEVTPDTLAELRSLDPNELVLFFFSGGWYFDYQRFPPKLQDYQLSFSIIGKLVPRGLVLSGKGTLSLPYASWESSCYYVGGRHSLEEWQENQGEMLQQQMRAGLDVCQKRLANNFKNAILDPQGGVRP